MKNKRNKQKRSRIRLYCEKCPRKQLLQTKQEKTLPIISLNPDNFFSDEKQSDILHEIQRRKIHISVIQETHIPHGLAYAKSGYGISTFSAITTQTGTSVQPGIYQGGVAILIHGELKQHIHHVGGIDHRINENSTKIA